MKYLLFKSQVVCLVISITNGAPILKSLRRKREETAGQGDYNLPPTEESHNPFSAGTNPIPFSPTQNGLPTFPYVHQFSQGIDVDPGDIFYMKGHLNVPVEGWGDMKGKLMGGPSHIWENYGHLLSPVDPLKLPAADTVPFAEAIPGALRDAEGERAPSDAAVPVASLPTGWTPVKCRPPFCNPYVHSFDTGLQVEPGNDAWIDGSLDLPIKSKEGNHFPLDGSLYAGTMPLQVLYGHVLTPIDPRAAQNKAAASNRQPFLDFKNLINRNHKTGDDLPPSPPHFRSAPTENKESTDNIYVTPPPVPEMTTVGNNREPFRLFEAPNSDRLGSQPVANDYVPRPKPALVLPPAYP